MNGLPGDGEDAVLRVATVEITRDLHPDGTDRIYVVAIDGSGAELALVEALGLLEIGKDTVIRERMGEVPGGGGDDAEEGEDP